MSLKRPVPKNERQLIIVAGPNGAGKTTLIKSFSSRYKDANFQIGIAPNPDDPNRPDLTPLSKQRIMLNFVDTCLNQNKSVIFETTGSAPNSIIRKIQQAKSQSYKVYFWYLWLPDTDYILDRVNLRVKQGGHFVPYEEIRRRFNRGLQNLHDYITKSDKATIIDGSSLTTNRFVAYINNIDSTIKIKSPKIWEQICLHNSKLKNLNNEVIYGSH